MRETKIDLFLLNVDILSWFYWFVLIPFPDWYNTVFWSLSSKYPSHGIAFVQLNTFECTPLWILHCETFESKKEKVRTVEFSRSFTIWSNIDSFDALHLDIWTPPRIRISLHISQILNTCPDEKRSDGLSHPRWSRDISLDALVHVWCPGCTLLVQLYANSYRWDHLKRSVVREDLSLSKKKNLTESVWTSARSTSGGELSAENVWFVSRIRSHRIWKNAQMLLSFESEPSFIRSRWAQFIGGTKTLQKKKEWSEFFMFREILTKSCQHFLLDRIRNQR